MAEKTVIESRYEKLVNKITWDNWEKTELDGKGNIKHWEISGVLYCRLDWLKEQIKSDTIEKDEALETIKMAQVLISGITDNQLKRSK